MADNDKKEIRRFYNIGLNLVFDIITAWLEDIISVKLGVEKDFLNYSQNYEFIKENLINIELQNLLSLVADIEKTRTHLKFSVNHELLLDNIFLSVEKLIV